MNLEPYEIGQDGWSEGYVSAQPPVDQRAGAPITALASELNCRF